MMSFSEFEQAYHDHFTTDANRCVFLGVDKLGDCLPNPSLQWAADQAAEAHVLLEQLERLNRADLDFDQRLDCDLAQLGLEGEIFGLTFQFNGRTTLQQLPAAGDEIGDGIFMLFINDPRPSEVRLALIAARLKQVPSYLDTLIQRLDTPVQRWVGIEVEKIDGLTTLFDSIAAWAEQEGWSGTADLREATEEAVSAVAAYRERLQALPTTEQFHVGTEAAARLVSLLGIDKSLDELHQMATHFLSDTQTVIDELHGRLVVKYELNPSTTVAELHAFLSQKYAVQLPSGQLGEVLDRYEKERAQILTYIQERDLFPVFEDQDIKMMQTPEFMAPSIPAGAMMPPAPFREGTRTSLVYLTLSEELLDEHTELSIPNMMIHEGIPGHHLQLATASLHPSIVRNHCSANDHAEGWTTMLEDYMLDLGYMGALTDEARFVGKRDISRIGARVAIDLFFMTGEKRFLDVGVDCDISSDDPFEAAGNLLQAVTGFVPGRVQAELNWYSQERGYPLSYLTGNTLVWELKRDIAKTQHGRLEGLALDRVFHRVYVETGNMPLRFLRGVYEQEGLLD